MYKAALQTIGEKVRQDFDAKDSAREKGLPLSREIIRNSANAIRSIHRGEDDEARALIQQNTALLVQLETVLADHPRVYWAGFVQDAQKEFAEANLTYALIHRQDLPGPDELKVDIAAYLNGMGEAVGELRRYILDQIRTRGENWGEDMLTAMDDIYYLLVSLDYPAAISGGLRRTADVIRSIIEKTRGDLTSSLRSKHLEAAMVRLEERLKQKES